MARDHSIYHLFGSSVNDVATKFHHRTAGRRAPHTPSTLETQTIARRTDRQRLRARHAPPGAD
jgi:hypothetical protein